MSVAEVFLCRKGALTDPSKAALRKAGVIVVEVENPDDCQFIRSSETVSGDDMLWAAMDALKRDLGYGNEGRKQREQFALNIAGMVEGAARRRRGLSSGGGNDA